MSIKSGRFNDVEGLICEHDRLTLQKWAILTHYLKGDAIEFGTCQGMSTLCIAQVLPSWHKLITIDICEKTSAIAIENLKRHGLDDRVTVVVQDVLNLALEIPPLSFAFIDVGDHTTRYNMGAFHHVHPKLLQGGVIAWHDYGGCPEVTTDVDGIVREGAYEMIEVVGATAVIRKR